MSTSTWLHSSESREPSGGDALGCSQPVIDGGVTLTVRLRGGTVGRLLGAGLVLTVVGTAVSQPRPQPGTPARIAFTNRRVSPRTTSLLVQFNISTTTFAFAAES